MSRSACSVLVGSPVEGPPRWMSMISRGSSRLTAVGGADRGADAGDLVLGLQGAHPEVLVLGQLVQDVRRRRDRVGAEEQRQPRQLAGSDEPPGQRRVAVDVGVGA